MSKDNQGSSDIGQAINAIMKDVEYVQKEHGGLKYTFVGEAALLSALRPAMVQHGVYVYPSRVNDVSLETYETSGGTVMNRTVATFEFTFMHALSGTSIVVQTIGEGADVGDKGCNKAMTVALKYALRQTFGIVTGDDPDMTASEGQQRKAVPAGHDSVSIPPARKTRPWSPDTIGAKFVKSIKTDNGDPCTENQAQYIASIMNDALSDSPTSRQDRLAILSWLTNRDIKSTTDLTFTEASAILNWLVDKETKVLQEAVKAELQRCLVPAMGHAGQLSLADWDQVPEVVQPEELQIFRKNAADDI